VSKNWGYNLGNELQGRFTFTVTGPQELASATLLIDGREVATGSQAPFRFPLDTGAYEVGQHTLSATGRTQDGQVLRSNDLVVQFVSAGRATESLQRIVLPLVALVLAISVLGTVGSSWLAGRRSHGSTPEGPRSYGLAGGAICPKCARPFPLTLFQPNMITGKLARCPYCGKWSVVRRASPQALAAAEAAERAAAHPTVRELSPEEKLRQQIEQSRYQP
jgi:hypothetical protein